MAATENQEDFFSAGDVRRRLRGPASELKVHFFESLPSTNSHLKAMAAEGAPHGSVVIAASQSAGRGQGDHGFFSPAESGLYLSVLLRPVISPDRLGLIGACAAVSVCRAIEELAPDKRPGIKWVNDILIDGKKVCGILSEAVLSSVGVNFVILGVGMNVFSPQGGFPPELRERASAIFDAPCPNGRSLLAAGFLNHLMEGIGSLQEAGLPTGYLARSLVRDRFVGLPRPDGYRRVRVMDIDENCHLTVMGEDGITQTLYSGPVELLP